MRYNWDIKQIRENYNLLLDLFIKENDQFELEKIGNDILIHQDMLNTFLHNNNFSENDEDIFFDELLDYLIYFYQTLTINHPDKVQNRTTLLNKLLHSYIQVANNYKDIDIIKPQIYTSNDDLIKICSDFFKQMTIPTIYQKFTNIIESDKKIIKIKYDKINRHYTGVTFFDYLLNNKYILVIRNNNLFDLTILPHEAFHYIFNTDQNAYLANYSNMYFCTEVEGSLANLLFADYFYNNATEYKNFFGNHELVLFKDNISDLVIRNALIDSLRDNKSIKFNKFNKYLSTIKIPSINSKDELKQYLYSPQEDIMKYSLSFLVAVDLYYIYLNDRELAFYLLKNLKFIKTENDLFSLFRNNNITFMDDNFHNLKKYIKKIEKQN